METGGFLLVVVQGLRFLNFLRGMETRPFDIPSWLCVRLPKLP